MTAERRGGIQFIIEISIAMKERRRRLLVKSKVIDGMNHILRVEIHCRRES